MGPLWFLRMFDEQDIQCRGLGFEIESQLIVQGRKESSCFLFVPHFSELFKK